VTEIWPNGPTVDEIKAEIADKYITQRWHPRLPLQILNYNAKTVHKGHWNEVTEVCRGLILDDQFNVIQRPFRKFWNMGEHRCPPIPDEAFHVYEKMDGCLGILYWEGTVPSIATRGSFLSWQALAATQWIRKTGLRMDHINPSWTYLFEYIHPNNRIVVNYENRETLVLLAVIEQSTGIDVPLMAVEGHLPGFERVWHRMGWDSDLHQLELEDRDNAEGYVLRFDGGMRVKIKHDSYVYLHRLVTQMTPRAIWELLKAGLNPLDMLEDYAPGDFRIWIKDQIEALWDAYEGIQDRCYADMLLRPDTDDRKATALYFQTCKHPSVLFAMLDEKPYSEIIWKMIRPAAGEPFRVEV
jgi:hypothetical protein